MNDATPYALMRTWWVGPHRATLTVPRAPRGASVIASVEWMPFPPKRLGWEDKRDFQTGCRQAVETVARDQGVEVLIQSPFFSIGVNKP